MLTAVLNFKTGFKVDYLLMHGKQILVFFIMISVTRLGNLFDFGQLFEAFVKVSKSIIFLVKSFLGNIYRHLAIFSGHTARNVSISQKHVYNQRCVD